MHQLWVDPRGVELVVRDGEVTLSGPFEDEDERDLVVRRIRLVPGVVSAIVHDTASR
jgi:osmotically-inducible protein OsmY